MGHTLSPDQSQRHALKGLGEALQAHQHLAVGPEIGEAIRRSWREHGIQLLMQGQGPLKLIEIAQATGQAPFAHGAVRADLERSDIAVTGGVRQVGEPESIGLVGQKPVVEGVICSQLGVGGGGSHPGTSSLLLLSQVQPLVHHHRHRRRHWRADGVPTVSMTPITKLTGKRGYKGLAAEVPPIRCCTGEGMR